MLIGGCFFIFTPYLYDFFLQHLYVYSYNIVIKKAQYVCYVPKKGKQNENKENIFSNDGFFCPRLFWRGVVWR